MENFWDFNVWGEINLIALLLIGLMVANILKRIDFIRNSLIPTSVLGGGFLLLLSGIYKSIFGQNLFDIPFFGGNGSDVLEIITYHSLAIGFIATALRPDKKRMTKQRGVEVFNTGITTVSTYLLQAILGFGITMAAAIFMDDFFAAAGVLLPFGYGQGTGQALNYGTIFQNDFGFAGGKSFGLTIAAFGFLSASIGGVIHLNVLKRKGKISFSPAEQAPVMGTRDVQGSDEIPMNGSMDKMSAQMALVLGTYFLAYLLIYVLGNLIPGFKSILYGFNFLFGVLVAVLLSAFMNKLRQMGIVRRQYLNGFLMNRISGFFFDLMIVAGVAAIRIDVLAGYWPILLILGIVGAISTYLYEHFVAYMLFPAYAQEQFLAMYGMLTGTASTGIILLREIDPDFSTPVADNLVYQNLPAIIFGFPMMFLAVLAPVQPVLTMIILIVFFAAMNVLLFRRRIFLKKK